jgi:hypothetical protein
MKAFKIIAISLGIGILPILLLKLYIISTGNLESRWLVVEYGEILIIWFLLFLCIGIIKAIYAIKRQ